jgi:hypothetical protein
MVAVKFSGCPTVRPPRIGVRVTLTLLAVGVGLLVFEVEPPQPVRRTANEENNAGIKRRPARTALLAKTRITVKAPWSPPVRGIC